MAGGTLLRRNNPLQCVQARIHIAVVFLDKKVWLAHDFTFQSANLSRTFQKGLVNYIGTVRHKFLGRLGALVVRRRPHIDDVRKCGKVRGLVPLPKLDQDLLEWPWFGFRLVFCPQPDPKIALRRGVQCVKILGSDPHGWSGPWGGISEVVLTALCQHNYPYPAAFHGVFTDPEGQIGGWIDADGDFMIGEGHHRMQAALDAAQESGNMNYVQKLLENGRWTRTDKFPTPPMPLPPVK